jgi:hypothetical protein
LSLNHQKNKHHADKNYYQISKENSKNSACLEINFIKICPEIALKYCFENNVVLYEIYSKKIEGDEYLCPWTVVVNSTTIRSRSRRLREYLIRNSILVG